MPDSTPFRAYNDADCRLPVVLSVPHAGRDYDGVDSARLAVPADRLVRLEDRHADRLAESACQSGIATIVAHAARAIIDLNRAENEIDPDMVTGRIASSGAVVSAKVRGGLGLFPRRLAGVGELWRGRMTGEEVDARIAAIHRPWHGRIAAMLEARRAAWGGAVLVDLHSMPSLPPEGGRPPAEVVIGDRHGSAASARISDLACALVREKGLRVALNAPYSGGYCLSRHGRPSANVHAIQVEINRALYLDRTGCPVAGGVERLGALVTAICRCAAEEIGGTALMAAE